MTDKPNPNSTTALTVQSQGFEPVTLQELHQLSRTLAVSSLIPEGLRQKPSDVAVVLMTGNELGLKPMQSLRSIHVIKGRGVMSADLIIGLCKKAAPLCRYFMLVSSDDRSATYETHRDGEPKPVAMTFTIEQAKTAGLLGNATWAKYPAAMLRARCGAALARAVYPDLVGGLYDTDEGREIDAQPTTASAAAQSHTNEVVEQTDQQVIDVMAEPGEPCDEQQPADVTATAAPTQAAPPANGVDAARQAILAAPTLQVAQATYEEAKRMYPQQAPVLFAALIEARKKGLSK